MDPYNPYNYPLGVPPPYPQGYIVPPTTYMAPPTVITPMVPPAYGYPQQFVQPPMVMQQPYAYSSAPLPNQNAYNYPTGPQIPGYGGYSNRSISGHKFQSGFRVKREHYHQF